MVGFDNEDVSFVFELTFNYGITSYKRGNDLHSILIHRFDQNGINIEEKLQKEFLGIDSTHVQS